jgi:hypothetical protein
MSFCNRIQGVAMALLLLVCLVSGCLAAKGQGSHQARSGQAARTGVWWSDPEVVKNAIVQYLLFEVSHREILSSDQNFYQSVMNLFLLFDAWGSDVALRELAALSSYHTGVAGGEIYSCIVVRKGPPMIEFLEREARGSGECTSRFPDAKRVCLDDEARRSRVRSLIHRIESQEECAVEQ